MTTSELIQVLLFTTGFRSSLRDEFGHWVSAFGRLPKSTPEPFQRGEGRFQDQPIVFNSRVEPLALTKAQLFSDLRRDHDASLSTNSYLCHQVLNVAELIQNGNKPESWHFWAQDSCREPRARHVDAVTAEWHALGPQALLLSLALGQRAVGADDSPPGEVGLVALEENRTGEAGCAG
jgi:hypothetical protein